MCPQTIFLEMLFRKIEWLIEGSAQQQVRRDKAPLTVDTAWRKALKHAIFFALSFLIANVFLAYIISADALWTIVTAPPREHVAGLFAISVFSLVFYAVFARFREQACTLACPYGRVMGALVDEHTITITYDRTRGEPRGKLGRGVQDVAARRLHRLRAVRHGVPDRHRHPQRHPARMRGVHGVRRCVRRRDAAGEPAEGPDSLHVGGGGPHGATRTA